ncbi:beta-ketoacyl synthase N-terminal-like domain-containing protein [Mycolicibacterium sp. CBMA 226]|uniref:beta-ketoacyl synthase N-terminal-like domain-containing protein n=1 Tax=Mycolicibacterium sp. CBMA 226 TaxID=2606611 RepID=UPI0012DCA546|nr:beta-ketoacyl synthase N-terminal-like domain-containing protein [Mycolicibacterium sp. CBMA 226]MUL75294.1 3-oxoacyl-ACP synthase [Mycolicibacterium sp. CBMA 226]
MTTTIDISGIGAVTGYGWGRNQLWDGLLSGKPAASLHAGYSTDGHDMAWLSRVPDGGLSSDGPTRSMRAMRAAVREAITDAKSRGWQPGRRVGLLHALVLPEIETWRAFYLEEGGQRRVRDYLALMPSTPVSMVMQEFGFHGPAMNVSAMCASGNAGMITAKMWMDCGIVDDVVFVSTDLSLTTENVAHFVKLGVAVIDSEPLDACRPFQEGSRGFAVGEASVAFVLTNQQTRGYAAMLGGAMTHDGYHVTSVDPARAHVDECVVAALENAHVHPEDIAFLNAHGPGTQQCDTAEAGVLDDLFDGRPGVYSVKPLTGHCQGAAAAVEIAAAALAYSHGVIPAAPRVAPGHRRLLDGPTPIHGGITLKTSLGMGGQNSAIVLSPPTQSA